MEKEPVIDDYPVRPNSIQIPHPYRQGPSTYEAILSNHPPQSMVLMRCGLLRSPVDLAGAKVLVAACPLKMQLAVAWVSPTRPPTALCHMPSRTSTSISCLILIGIGRHFIRTISENWETNMQLSNLTQIWVNDHLSCGFGLWRIHLALEWKSGQVRSDFVRQHSQVHFMSISTHW